MNELIPTSVREILADPPLMRGEDAAGYERLVGQLSAPRAARRPRSIGCSSRTSPI